MSKTRPEILPGTGDGINRAADLLRNGRLVAFPTETVYGLGGNALSDATVASIFEVKGRPSFNPLIIHFSDPASAAEHVEMSAMAHRLAEAFWPGPLTLVLPRAKSSAISLLASAGLDTLAIRIPANPIAQSLLRACNCPLAAPSANRSGSISPTTADHVARSLGADIAAILDDGPCTIGIESTVIGFMADDCVMLRPGGMVREDIEAITGRLLDPDSETTISSPGMLQRHYAPETPVFMNCVTPLQDSLVLAFGPVAGENFPTGSCNLSPTGNLNEAAANLFAMLRELDRAAPSAITVMPVPHHGLGVAINDRLVRAASNHDRYSRD